MVEYVLHNLAGIQAADKEIKCKAGNHSQKRPALLSYPCTWQLVYLNTAEGHTIVITNNYVIRWVCMYSTVSKIRELTATVKYPDIGKWHQQTVKQGQNTPNIEKILIPTWDIAKPTEYPDLLISRKNMEIESVQRNASYENKIKWFSGNPVTQFNFSDVLAKLNCILYQLKHHRAGKAYWDFTFIL